MVSIELVQLQAQKKAEPPANWNTDNTDLG